MDLAVLLMKVGAGLSLLGLVLSFASRGSIRSAVEDASATGDTQLTASQIDAAVGLASGVGIFFGLVGVGLWLWMASANGKGRSWARIVATAFYVISVLSFFFSFLQPGALLSRLVSLVSVALGGYIIFLLFRPESSAYYQAMSAKR